MTRTKARICRDFMNKDFHTRIFKTNYTKCTNYVILQIRAPIRIIRVQKLSACYYST